MTYETSSSLAESKPRTDGGGAVSHNEQATLGELIEVLSAHPRGLRRWSVMRAMRASRARRGRDIPHKFEDEVERIFRRRCAESSETRPVAAGGALFYRPKETAGEVWAILPTREDEPNPSV
jgi:hypothetical protein